MSVLPLQFSQKVKPRSHMLVSIYFELVFMSVQCCNAFAWLSLGTHILKPELTQSNTHKQTNSGDCTYHPFFSYLRYPVSSTVFLFIYIFSSFSSLWNEPFAILFLLLIFSSLEVKIFSYIFYLSSVSLSALYAMLLLGACFLSSLV